MGYGGCEPRIEGIVQFIKRYCTILRKIKTRIDVYETLCPQQMLVHIGGKFKNWGGEWGVQRCHTYKIAVSKYI